MCLDAVPLPLSIDLQEWAANKFSFLFLVFPCREHPRFILWKNVYNKFNMVMILA